MPRRESPVARVSVLAPMLFSLSACLVATVENPAGRADFEARCTDPSVLRCVGFEADELRDHGGSVAWGTSEAPVGTFVNGFAPGEDLTGRVELATDQQASGASSLKFFVPSGSDSGYAGQFYANFSDDYSVQFGEGDEFYVQWRQRFSKSFLDNAYRPNSRWKQAIIGEGNRPGYRARSCTQLEIVVNNGGDGFPEMYHSCRGKDGRSEAVPTEWAVDYQPDQWMTFQVHVKIGTWYRNDRNYRSDSLLELWVAPEGEPSELAVRHEFDLANENPLAGYGKVWLLPYLTRKDPSQVHPDAYTWYDELIISAAPIADPL